MNQNERDLRHQKDENSPVPRVVNNEMIDRLHFPTQDVLRIQQEKLQRTTILSKILSRLSFGIIPATIFFEDISGVKKVNTTIQAISENEVVIHQKARIPIHRITEICLEEYKPH